MITGLLVVLAMAIFGGGGQATFFLNPDVKKDIKMYVPDKDRQKEIYSIIDAMEKDQKSFTKQKHKYYEKEAAELNINYIAAREDFNALFSKYLDERTTLQLQYWDKESKIRAIFKTEEWNLMMENLLKKPDKEDTRKAFEKVSDNMFKEIEESCKKIISDSTASSNSIQAIDNQKVLVNQVIDEYVNLDYYHAEALRNQKATLEDFKKVIERINTLRFTILSHYFDLRFDLVKHCSPSEWKKLSKEFTKVFIEGKGINKK